MGIVCSVIAARLHLFQPVPFGSEACYFMNYLVYKEVVSGLLPIEKLPVGNISVVHVKSIHFIISGKLCCKIYILNSMP
jgi:hypothetical protein